MILHYRFTSAPFCKVPSCSFYRMPFPNLSVLIPSMDRQSHHGPFLSPTPRLSLLHCSGTDEESFLLTLHSSRCQQQHCHPEELPPNSDRKPRSFLPLLALPFQLEAGQVLMMGDTLPSSLQQAATPSPALKGSTKEEYAYLPAQRDHSRRKKAASSPSVS